jgi:hypothetical protein
MFILDGIELKINHGFSHDGIKYPANWLALATADDLSAIGIDVLPDPQPFNAEFQDGWNSDKTPIWRNLAVVKQEQIEKIERLSNEYLAPTNKLIIAEYETGVTCPPEIKQKRQNVRNALAQKIARIEACATVKAVADLYLEPLATIVGQTAVVNTASFMYWPTVEVGAYTAGPEYRLFWDALVASTVYGSIRTQSMASLPMNTLATEFIALIGDAKAGRANEAAIQASMSAVFATGTFTEDDAAEFTAALAAGLLTDIYSLT